MLPWVGESTQDVRVLRSRQFPEDAGPLSHPIRPESYIAMDNFYTATVYVKGAEVCFYVCAFVSVLMFHVEEEMYYCVVLGV